MRACLVKGVALVQGLELLGKAPVEEVRLEATRLIDLHMGSGECEGEHQPKGVMSQPVAQVTCPTLAAHMAQKGA